MSAIQKLFRRDQTRDPIRESAALTTVYLLELNKKFEVYVREKIEALEPVVSSLEARGGQADDDWDDDWSPADDQPDQDNDPALSAPDDGSPSLTEMKLVTPMAAPLPETESEVETSAPGKEPGRTHQTLRNETGVGATFSFSMFSDDAEPDTGNTLLWQDEGANGPPANDPGSDEMASAGNTPAAPPEASVTELEEEGEMEAWERSLADDLPAGPVGEYE
jgi:hypothetical protein